MKESQKYTFIILVVIFSIFVIMFVLSNNNEEKIINKPTSSIVTSQWIKGKDKWSGIEFEYPSSLGAKYMTPGVWPPTISRIEDHDECGPADFQEKSMKFSLKPINFGYETYCFLSGTNAEGKTVDGKKVVYYVISKPEINDRISFSLTLYYFKCEDLPELEQFACQKEQESFNLIELAHNVLSTVSQD